MVNFPFPTPANPSRPEDESGHILHIQENTNSIIHKTPVVPISTSRETIISSSETIDTSSETISTSRETISTIKEASCPSGVIMQTSPFINIAV